jgi:hypothetical protein
MSTLYPSRYSINASMPPRGYKLLGAVALAGLIAALIVNNSAPPAPPKVEAAKVIAPVLPRIAAVVPVDKPIAAPAPVDQPPPKIVKTTVEVVAPPPAAEPEPAPVIEHPHRDRVADLDICARHGLHKIITRNGRGWRCR